VKKKGEKMLNKFLRHEKGITGLETAIILIAFVVVAAVFAYTALSAGLFSTQKAQEAVYSGLKEAQSTLEMKGAVIATANITGDAGDGACIGQISFTVSNVLGGEAIDFTEPSGHLNGVATGIANKVVINYIDDNQEKDNLYWTITKVGNADADSLLEQGEKFQINVGGGAGNNLVDALTTDLGVNQQFSLQILTPNGAVLTIERTTPPNLDTINDLR
jgi:archaeal flagellin FlaB